MTVEGNGGVSPWVVGVDPATDEGPRAIAARPPLDPQDLEPVRPLTVAVLPVRPVGHDPGVIEPGPHVGRGR